MSAVAASPGGDDPAARLATPLLRLAARVLADVPPGEALEAAAAVRAFAGEPTPARYLAATRALRAAERGHKLGLLSRAGGGRRLEQGLDALARNAGLSPALLDALRGLPDDARNGRRLTIISELLTAHRLVLARASMGHRELLQSLGPMRRSPRPPDRRRRKPGR